MKLYSEYYETINKNSREYMKHKYHTDEKYKEYQRQKPLDVIINIEQPLKINYF